MKIFLNMLLVEWKINRRNLFFILAITILPLLLIILFGGLYGNDLTPKNIQLFNMGAVSASAPAYLALALGIISLIGLPQQLVWYKENKVLKRLKATPIKHYQILLPIFIIYLGLFIVGMLLLFLYAFIVYGVKLEGNFFSFFFSLVLSVVSMFSIGFLLSCICKTSKQVTAIGFLLLIPMLFLSGATMPMGAFPDIMNLISKFFPLSHCVELMKSTFNNTQSLSSIWVSILVLGLITIICSTLSIKLFKWE